jgi:hypothetical protein
LLPCWLVLLELASPVLLLQQASAVLLALPALLVWVLLLHLGLQSP